MNTVDFININVNNHKLRSQYIQNLIQRIDKVGPKSADLIEHFIPKVLIQFWDDLKTIPNDVQECLDSWITVEEEGFVRLLFDNDAAEHFIETEFDQEHLQAYKRCHHPAMKCDYFRLCYILQNGGIYVDADEWYQYKKVNNLLVNNRLKLNPLCYDIKTDLMVPPQQFINQSESDENWIFYVNNNPIIAPAGHPLIHRALARSTEILIQSEYPIKDIQSATGPGNMSASLVAHAITLSTEDMSVDFEILHDWDKYSITPWPLSYRNDKRNWRLWKP